VILVEAALEFDVPFSTDLSGLLIEFALDFLNGESRFGAVFVTV
jgi:hypothetical protein